MKCNGETCTDYREYEDTMVDPQEFCTNLSQYQSSIGLWRYPLRNSQVQSHQAAAFTTGPQLHPEERMDDLLVISQVGGIILLGFVG